MYRVPEDEELPMKTFRYSISYLGFLFAAVLIDHYLLFRISL
jgi:heme O synthase-like polyprenyltransferase